MNEQTDGRSHQTSSQQNRRFSFRSLLLLLALAVIAWSILLFLPNRDPSDQHSREGVLALAQRGVAAGAYAIGAAASFEAMTTAWMPSGGYDLPVDLNLAEKAGLLTQFLIIALATFIFEDLTCISVGMLIRAGELSLLIGALACLVGIFAGDMGLWLLGRFGGRRLVRWKRLGWLFPAARLDRWGEWFDRHGWTAVIASRCLPGTRLPTYIGAGMVGHNSGRFALWTLTAGVIWTPLLISLAALFGPIAARPFEALFGTGWISLIAALLTLYLLIRLLLLLSIAEGRSRVMARVSRLWQYEFWPQWLFYLPLVPWIIYLALRYEGLTTATAANPAIQYGGVAGESKYRILQPLIKEQQRWVAPTALIKSGKTPAQRYAQFQETMRRQGWTYPVILKPDVAERGLGLRLARDDAAALAYFAEMKGDVLAQVYHPGPYEAGIFYYRLPGRKRGCILSITDKEFPVVVGDGKHTLRQLVWLHPRYRMQAARFLQRHKDRLDHVFDRGEKVALGVAGNHSQGARFRDGTHLLTPALSRRLDAIAASIPDFDFGRLDVRYSDVEQFRAGEDMTIIEANGALSECTNIYDPEFTLVEAHRMLFRQWAILFQIGALRLRQGAEVSDLREVIAQIARHLRSRPTSIIAD